jgi:DNA-directed RNA polymerase subunit E'/Rpb7
MAQYNLYNEVQLESKISLQPKQLTAKLDTHIINNLKEKVEKKVGEHGIVVKVKNVVNYDYGLVSPSDFTGSVIYNVKYNCLLCSVSKGMEIIAQIVNIGKGLYIASNGPLIGVIYSYEINTDRFREENAKIFDKETGQELQKETYVKMFIITYKSHLGETQILAICRLLDIASKKEIKIYQKEQKLATGLEINEEEGKEEYI